MPIFVIAKRFALLRVERRAPTIAAQGSKCPKPSRAPTSQPTPLRFKLVRSPKQSASNCAFRRLCPQTTGGKICLVSVSKQSDFLSLQDGASALIAATTFEKWTSAVASFVLSRVVR